MELALGLIETKGLVGAIEAADAMAKAADIKVINKEKSTAALVTIKVVGEVAAVKAAVDAGSSAAQRVGQLLSAHIIPRPDAQIDFIVEGTELINIQTLKRSKKPRKRKKVDASLFDDVEPTIPKDQEEKKAVEDRDQKSAEDSVIGMDHLERLKREARSELEMDEDKSVLEVTKTSIPFKDDLLSMNVHQLRHLARNIENFPIKGREISKANRKTLLEFFEKLR
ncbi:BMC domain-containing protein [Bacteroidota bacterium]